MSAQTPATALVETVLGPVSADALGVTLMHEHLLIDGRAGFAEPVGAAEVALAHRPVAPDILHYLRQDPYGNRDNCGLFDETTATEEIARFRDAGGATVVDPTCLGIGRDPRALARIARRTGLNIVMGAGYYLERTHPPELAAMSIDDIRRVIVSDLTDGDPATGIRAGIIGEIGVGPHFTPAEQKSLRGAARAQADTGATLSVHLPGWERLGHRVLDVVAEEGGDPSHTILDHMNPSGRDLDYQTALADRGAWLEYDMIGLDYYFANEDSQSPGDTENAEAITALIARGYGDRLLLSQDVFLKMMLTRHGGNGYGYILEHFVPRLRRLGVAQAAIDAMLITNPARAFGGRGRATSTENP